MEKFPCWVITALLLLAAMCTNNKEGLKADTNDIESGVFHNGQNIILADRNLGATEVDRTGTYLTLDQAKSACPEGYHLMTRSEAKALIADSRYSTPEKFMAAFHIPNSNYVGTDSIANNNNFAQTSTQENSVFLHLANATLTIDAGSEHPSFSFNAMSNAFCMNLRCVKGEVVSPESSVRGSFTINEEITIAPQYAGLRVYYADNAQTRIAGIWVTLSTDEPIEAYEIEPEEYISLDFLVDPTHPNRYILDHGYYTSSILNKDVDLPNAKLDYTNSTTLEYDPTHKTFALSLDIKESNKQIAKGSAKGSYISIL